MQRNEAIDRLASFAAELRLAMKMSNEGVLPPEILCIFAWEESIHRRYAAAYLAAPADVKIKIDEAKERCAAHSPVPLKSDEREIYVNRIMKGDISPVVVQKIKCPGCSHTTEVVSLMDNMAGARPFWTYFMNRVS